MSSVHGPAAPKVHGLRGEDERVLRKGITDMAKVQMWSVMVGVVAMVAFADCSAEDPSTNSSGPAGSGGTDGTASGSGSGTMSSGSGTTSSGSGGSSAGSTGSGGSSAAGGGPGTGGSVSVDAGRDAKAATEAGGGAPTFAQVEAIIGANCRTSGCHHSGTGTGVNNHVDLRANGLYGRLMMDVTGAGAAKPEVKCMSTSKLVVPNSPQTSLLLGMLGTVTSARMGCGARMPDGCKPAGPVCLTTAQIQTIQNWINAGAPNN